LISITQKALHISGEWLVFGANRLRHLQVSEHLFAQINQLHVSQALLAELVQLWTPVFWDLGEQLVAGVVHYRLDDRGQRLQLQVTWVLVPFVHEWRFTTAHVRFEPRCLIALEKANQDYNKLILNKQFKFKLMVLSRFALFQRTKDMGG